MLAERAGAPRLLILLALLTIAAIAVFVHHHHHHHRAPQVRHQCGCQVPMDERFVLVSAPAIPVTEIVVYTR
jgi:hypothetical protein